MGVLVCEMKECKHRSKRKLRKVKHTISDRPCYGCLLPIINIHEVFDYDGEIQEYLGRRIVECVNYEPLYK